jgi:hypothetical protein
MFPYGLLSFLLVATVDALACYETAASGLSVIKEDDAWQYCVIVPAIAVPGGGESVKATQFGLGPDNEGLSAYDVVFAMSGDGYRILTLCSYEVFVLYLTVGNLIWGVFSATTSPSTHG